MKHDSGHAAAEFQQARRQVALAPRNKVSLMWLRKASLANGRPALAAQADRLLEALPHDPRPWLSDPLRPGFGQRGQP